MSSDAPAPRIRVLLLATDAGTRASSWRRLEEAGYEVEAVSDELSVLQRLEAPDRGFDVLVLDGDFKHVSGADMANRAERLHPRMPVVWCTNKPQKLSRSSTVARLPVSSVGEKLTETVARALERSRRK